MNDCEERQKLINKLFEVFMDESFFKKSSDKFSLARLSLEFYQYIKDTENFYSEEQLHKMLKLIKKMGSRNIKKEVQSLLPVATKSSQNSKIFNPNNITSQNVEEISRN